MDHRGGSSQSAVRPPALLPTVSSSVFFARGPVSPSARPNVRLSVGPPECHSAHPRDRSHLRRSACQVRPLLPQRPRPHACPPPARPLVDLFQTGRKPVSESLAMKLLALLEPVLIGVRRWSLLHWPPPGSASIAYPATTIKNTSHNAKRFSRSQLKPTIFCCYLLRPTSPKFPDSRGQLLDPSLQPPDSSPPASRLQPPTSTFRPPDYRLHPPKRSFKHCSSPMIPSA